MNGTALKTVMLAGLLLTGSSSAVQAADVTPAPTMESLQADLQRLQGNMPGQAFAMTQVAYNFNNLWFAGRAKNWALAQFYANETKVRLRWAVRLQPVRKITSGNVELTPFATALESNQLASVEKSIAEKNATSFVAGYTAMMHGCQACHEAMEKPFLKLQIPTVPAEGLIKFAP
ncbi:MAG: hypothetical protein ABIQ86_08685 [Steroidobacteraceae bacterium]